jgi:peroxiredoxin
MRLAIAGFLAGACAVSPALAALPTGTPAPEFVAPATLGGTGFTFNLADALKKGPVVVYFYPKAFTSGCTQEAHDFASAMPQYNALHATVIGVSMDGIDKLKKFSTQECSSAFPLASDASGKISHEYDAVLPVFGVSARTSYVIAPTGQVIYAYNAMSPDAHVANTIKAVKEYEAAHPGK